MQELQWRICMQEDEERGHAMGKMIDCLEVGCLIETNFGSLHAGP